MSKLETIIQLVKICFGIYFVYVSWQILQVLSKLNGI